ncbi:MAG: pyrroline-5-carboxylate reductase [Ruminococcus sp.]
MKLGFIGYGNMAGAMAQGLVQKGGMDPSAIYASARNYDKLVKNAGKLGIQPCRSNNEVTEKCDVIVLAVKPYQMVEVTAPLKEKLKGKMVISIAAGMLFEDYEKILEEGTHHISTVPNTPICTGEGILICEEKHSLNESEMTVFKELFAPVSLIEFVESHHMSIAGTLAGCAPAFTAMYLEALSDGAVKHGLSRAASYRLAAQMIKGVGDLYLTNQEHPGAMKDAVCSPGGTTIKGVASLEKNGFRGAVIDAIDAIVS